MTGKIPDKIWLYRIVHWKNVHHILHHGMMTRTHPLADSGYVDIGHRQLITDRSDHTVRIQGMRGPEGSVTLGDYIPFYFGPHSPMLYTIMNGYSGVTKTPQKDIVYIICSLDSVKACHCEYIFSDMHAKKSLACFFSQDTDLQFVDWQVVRSKDWSNNENDLDRRDRKQAEFLVKSHVPVEAIDVIGVLTKDRAGYVQNIVSKLGLNIRVFLDDSNKLYY